MRKWVGGVFFAIAPIALLHCVGDDPGPADVSAADAAGADGASSNGEGGQPSTDGATPTNDGATPNEASADGGDAGPNCDPTKPFGAPAALTQVNTADTEEEARIAGNELFVTRYPGGQPRKIYRYTRTGPSAPWLNPVVEDALNKLPDGGTTTVTSLMLASDGKTAFLGYYPASESYIYVATRSGPGQPFGTPGAVNGLPKGEAPWLSADDQRLYFFNNTAGNFHTFQATRNVNGFSNVVALGITGPTEDRHAVLSADEKTIYFAAYSPPPGGGASNKHIYKATRMLPTDNFDTATYVDELNETGQESAPSWLSPDGCSMLFFGTRTNSGGYDIYKADKPL